MMLPGLRHFISVFRFLLPWSLNIQSFCRVNHFIAEQKKWLIRSVNEMQELGLLILKPNLSAVYGLTVSKLTVLMC